MLRSACRKAVYGVHTHAGTTSPLMRRGRGWLPCTIGWAGTWRGQKWVSAGVHVVIVQGRLDAA